MGNILENLIPCKFDKEKNFFVSDLAKNLNPGTLKRFLSKKFSENFFGPSENFFSEPKKSSQRFSIFLVWEVEIPEEEAAGAVVGVREREADRLAVRVNQCFL